MLLTVAGAVVAVVAAAVMVAFAGDDEGGSVAGSGPAAAVNGTPEATEATVADEPSASPSASPSPKPSSQRPTRPADLVAGLRATLRGLIEQGQVSRDAGEELDKRLQEAGEHLADGEANKARKKLREFAEKLVDLRKEDKIGSAGYDVLIAEATQLAQALPGR